MILEAPDLGKVGSHGRSHEHASVSAETESSPEYLADELLALTKMNWNQTQLKGHQPITIRTADRVGEILRHLGQNGRPQGRYAYYM